MTKKNIRWIILLSGISLIGLVVTQLFWINNAIRLGEEQFDNRVTIALQGALDEYVQKKSDPGRDEFCGCLMVDENTDSLFINLEPAMMDSLLKVHFNYHGLDTLFDFRVVKCATSETIFSLDKLKDKSNTSSHRISLSCLHHHESHHLEVSLLRSKKLILFDLLLWLSGSIVFLITLVLCFAFIVVGILRQKKISEIRNDFINNMTHEFRTPISNISLACEILERQDLVSAPDRLNRYIAIVKEENRRMRSQVDRVLQFAQRNHEDHTVHRELADVHELIRESVEHVCLTECLHGAHVDFDLKAENPLAWVDPVHFSNIIHNLLDNAQKYCDSKPEIHIATYNKNNQLFIEFRDNGIGISHDQQKRIFEKFYRVPTGDLHNVKGFGLGLYYVKTILEEQGGSIRVESTPGEGTRFIIILAQ